MKWKRSILALIALFAMSLGGWGTILLWDARLWPFSTGTHDEAFLDTTFGMSPQEVRRSLARHGAQLLTYGDYKKEAPSPSISQFEFVPLFSDDRNEDSALYMPAIEMFNAKAEAQFTFRRERLASVEIYLDPVVNSRSESLVATLTSKLQSKFAFGRREESREVAGAYRLFFTSASADPSLWVNLTDRKRPIIILTIVHPATQMARKREIDARESTAFGKTK